MNRKIIASGLILWYGFLGGTPVMAATDPLCAETSLSQATRTDRLSGQTRYQTAKVISEYYANGTVKNVILATGNEFADALSASVLAHEKEASILLVDATVDSSKEALDYVRDHLDPAGTAYLIGGAGVIAPEFETKLHEMGFQKTVRIAGRDRYDTSSKVAALLNTIPLTTVVIASGEQYPDALSISSFAANRGWPILLSPHDALPQEMKDFLKERKPSKVYITGGTGAISDTVQSSIKSLLPEASVERLTGQSRFDTNAAIARTFAPNPSTVYLATGYGFADALAGSAVAAKKGDPILFIDPSVPTLPRSVAGYLGKLFESHFRPDLISFGGSGVVTDAILQSSCNLLSGTAQATSIHSIDDITVTVTQNENYVLPTTVQVKLYNSDTLAVPVKWKSTRVDTGKVGSSVYVGVVEGYAKEIKLNLTIKEPAPIAQYATHFDAGLVNRTENIRLAAKALDGKRLAPGERFSFNESVGERTNEAGYKEALIIEGDAFIPGIGGGVCQVSSTLYNAVMLAHLEILERHRHSLPISYVPPGQDATVAFPVLDFKFRNSTNTTLIIRSFVEGDTLTFKLYEQKEK